MRPSEKWILSAERAAEGGQLSYQRWFDIVPTLEAVRSQACVDLFGKIMTPDVLATLGDPATQDVLEIGSGGGRLLGCAGQMFRRAVGVDIVYERPSLAAMTRELHRSWGVEDRCRLIVPTDLPSLPDASFGFIYSFIVFQHFDSEQVVLDYLLHARRLIRPGGAIRIFIGRSTSSVLYRADSVTFDPDNLHFESTLQVPLPVFEQIAGIAGLRVARTSAVRKQPWMDAASSQVMVDLVCADAL